MDTLLNEKLIDGFKYFGFNLSEFQLNSFSAYFDLLKFWKDKINITSIDRDEEIIIKHFIDSISSAKYFDFNEKKVVDIGTGAGFPGIPLKILVKSMDITLIDSSNKKIEFIKKVCQELNIENIELICNNIEAVGRDENHREKYDFCISRAVAPLNVLIEYSVPFLKKNGKSIFYKGPAVDNEVDNSKTALVELGSKIDNIIDFSLPFSDHSRKLISVEKIVETKDKYPRKTGIPRKRQIK